jgi:hypothetical protein
MFYKVDTSPEMKLLVIVATVICFGCLCESKANAQLPASQPQNAQLPTNLLQPTIGLKAPAVTNSPNSQNAYAASAPLIGSPMSSYSSLTALPATNPPQPAPRASTPALLSGSSARKPFVGITRTASAPLSPTPASSMPLTQPAAPRTVPFAFGTLMPPAKSLAPGTLDLLSPARMPSFQPPATPPPAIPSSTLTTTAAPITP